MRLFWPLLGSIATGIMLAAALPPADHGQLAWFALAPLFLAVAGRGFLVGFLFAGLAMVVSAQAVLNGVFIANRTADGDAAWLYVCLFLYGIVLAVVTGVVGEARELSLRKVLQISALAVLLEAMTLVHVPANYAITQYRAQPIVHLASVFGIWGVSFLLYASNILAASIAHGRRWRWWPALLIAVAVPVLGTALPSSGPTKPIMVAAVQLDDAEDLDLPTATSQAANSGAELVVWPEFAGISFVRAGRTDRLQALSESIPGTGIVTSFPDGTPPLSHNAASLFLNGTESARYFKRRLFGSESNMHTPGILPGAAALGDHRVGLNICFDSCDPRVFRDTARLDNVDIIALPTIDPSSPHHFMAALHAAYTPFRSAETGRPIVRADANAFSMVTSATGRIVGEAGPGQGRILVVPVGSSTVVTVASVLGDWFAWACLPLFLVTLRRKSVATARDTAEAPEEMPDRAAAFV